MKHFLLISLAVLMLASCKREEYVSPETALPVFKMQGTVNGEPFTLAAGQNQVYQTSAIDFNSFGVYEFKSQFMEHGCSSCEPVFEVLISADETQQQYDPVDNEILSVGSIPYALHPNISDYLSVHYDIQNDFGTDYSWDFGDGNTGSGHEPSHTYNASGVYEVVLVQSNGAWTSDVIITQSILVGEQVRLAKPFGIWNEAGNGWEFTLPGNLPPGLVIDHWTINGNEYPANNLELNLSGTAEVCLHFYNTIAEQAGYYCVSFDADQSGDFFNFVNYQWMSPELNLGRVALKYRSPEGEIYTSYSDLNDSDPQVFFTVDNVEEYSNGIDGHPAKRIKVFFNGFLVNDNDPGDILHFEGMEAELGFKYE